MSCVHVCIVVDVEWHDSSLRTCTAVPSCSKASMNSSTPRSSAGLVLIDTSAVKGFLVPWLSPFWCVYVKYLTLLLLVQVAKPETTCALDTFSQAPGE
jgi:hypothetical protein